jgi:hypothetical protein
MSDKREAAWVQYQGRGSATGGNVYERTLEPPSRDTEIERLEWPELANDIRAVDGNHDLGAGELAARLVERGWRRSQPASEPSLDVERLARAMSIVGPFRGWAIAWEVWLRDAATLAAEYHRFSQPAANEAAE